jgi:holo-[acyl-carrier protein] synthase
MSENATSIVRFLSLGYMSVSMGEWMIIGIGTDCCEVERIAGAIERRGDRFLMRVFTGPERAEGAKRPEPAAYFARRFAAKEACVKALGSGITEHVRWQDVEVLNGPKGQPTLRLTGGALRRLNRLMPKGHEPALHVSLADDPPVALAFVVLEARLKI